MELIRGLNENISEVELLDAIRIRVAKLLDTDAELLMSYLYRLDILEEKIQAVLAKNSPVAPVEGLALLILERQKERVRTKKLYRQAPIEGWDW